MLDETKIPSFAKNAKNLGKKSPNILLCINAYKIWTNPPN